MDGGVGRDTMDGGVGRDTMLGNSGADIFVFAADGATDTILDFANGTDIIDMDLALAALTITDIAPGEVHITHSGEVLEVFETSGALVAADLTIANFL